MIDSNEFFKAILDTMSENIVVIDQQGDICFVNQRWIHFAQSNQCSTHMHWNVCNYLKVCDLAAKNGDQSAQEAAVGIRRVINRELETFYQEYPCDSPEEKRWFMMRVSPLFMRDDVLFVISHQDITARKQAEEEVLNLSRLDGLTNIPNRRYFDEFMQREWLRGVRNQVPMTLAFIDIDHFKRINDSYGHGVGDKCLVALADLLKQFARRPCDLYARYGGEEFAIIFGNTTLEKSLPFVNRLLEAIRLLEVRDKNIKEPITMTASIGLKSVCPNINMNSADLVYEADALLYLAKQRGRNQVVFQSESEIYVK